MFDPRPLFVGRQRELAMLARTIADAQAGRGSLLLVTGEPGIGKSRFCEEAAGLAANQGFIALWGRAWEEGGAPAYWPWTQIVRSLARGRDAAALSALFGRRGQVIEHLIEGLGQAPADQAAALLAGDGEQAQFQLFDAVAGSLADFAVRTPLLLVLEDLHAADASSLLLLDFLGRQLPTARLLVLATARDVSLHSERARMVLARVARAATSLPLPRLPASAVAEYLQTLGGRAPSAELLRSFVETTEGNPLFLVEVARLFQARGWLGSDLGTMSIPETLQSTLRERLDRLPRALSTLLATASVLGREFAASALAELTQIAPDELAGLLAQAEAAAVVLEYLPHSYRFQHVLFREVLYQGLPLESRRRLHAQAAHVLETTFARPNTAWSEIAHHLQRAGAPAAELVRGLTRAGRSCLLQLAFDDAARLLDQARQTAESQPELLSARQWIELWIDLGRAQLSTGDRAAGGRSCAEAAKLAAQLGDAKLVATAALAHGSVFVFGEVDPALVELLQQALVQLGEDEVAMRARVMARLAAAMQPARNPHQPMDLARQAIALGRSAQDQQVLHETLRSACSALMDLGPPPERQALNQEYITLSRALDNPSEALRGQLRLVFDHFELGDMTRVSAAIEAARALATELDHPHYQWRVCAFDAMHAMWLGEFRRSSELNEQARELARSIGDARAERSLLIQQAAILDLQGRGAGLTERATELARSLGSGLTSIFARGCLSAYFARAGDFERARASLDPELIEITTKLADLSLNAALASSAFYLGDVALAERLEPVMQPHRRRFVSGGMVALFWGPPLSHALGQVASVRGQWHDAARLLDDAEQQSIARGGRPHAAWIAFEHGLVLLRHCEREPGSQRAELLAQARRKLEQALGHARDLAMPEFRERVSSLSSELAAGEVAHGSSRPQQPGSPMTHQTTPAELFQAGALRMVHAGEFWVVQFAGTEMQLRDSKGLRLLAKLVGMPACELHVLDLINETGEAVDGGDAGPPLDAQAIASYRARHEELRAELAQATEWNDSARVERLQNELELLGAELGRATGLGGRERRLGSATERARVNVQRRLKDAVQRVEQSSPELAKHLSKSLKTGTYCRYQPE